MRLLRQWQRLLAGIELEGIETIPEPLDSHDSLEDFEIVEPPEDGEDQEQNHGGDDACCDVEGAPEREEAQGEPQEGDPSESPESQGEEEGESQGEGESQEEAQSSSSQEPSPLEGEGEWEEGEDEGEDEGERNHQQTFSLAAAKKRRIATAFSIVVGKIADDLSGWPIEGDEEWDIQAIMERRITKRPLSQCRQSREKESVVVILDTSGSCYQQAKFFAAIADAAVKNGDVELYDAPNGEIVAVDRGDGWKRTESWEWDFHGRTIIFFSDFDGGDFPVEASWNNKVYWFSCEGDRYEDMDEHSWCSFTLAEFRGKYYDCLSEDDFIRLVRKVR